MIHAPKHDAAERVMAAVHGLPVSYGQRYRTLVIEDVEA